MTDDKRTRDTLDALAELYLTGTKPGQGSDAAHDSSPNAAGPLKYNVPPTDPLSGPRPIRIGPRVPRQGVSPRRPSTAGMLHSEGGVKLTPSLRPQPMNARPAQSNHINDVEGDAPLGDAIEPSPAPTLRLHRDDPGTPAPGSLTRDSNDESHRGERRSHAALIPQAVFLGNLPGFGGPWLAQYAHHLAREGDAAVVLHLEPDEADLELITAHGSKAQPGDADENLLLSQWASDSVRLNLEEMLDSLLHDAPVRANDWLFHFTRGEPGEIAKRAAPLGQWTWLCGADEAAIAGAAQQITGMLGVLPKDERPTLAVMVMGCDPQAAAAAAGRLNEKVFAAAGVHVELIGSQRQMGPVTLHRLGTFHESHAEEVSIRFALEHTPDIREEQRALEPAAPEKVPEAAIEAVGVDAQPNPALAVSTPEPTVNTPRTTRMPAFTATPRPASAASAVPAAAPSPRPTPRPASPPTAAPPVADVTDDTPELVDFLLNEIPGSVALDALYPKRPEARMVLGEDGQLHMGLRHEAGDLAATLVTLMEARAWASEHLALLRLTQRQLRFKDAEPMIHLFTDDARAATALVGRMGQAVTLHLLQEVRLGGEAAFVCTALN